jgi:hypothetical protein
MPTTPTVARRPLMLHNLPRTLTVGGYTFLTRADY